MISLVRFFLSIACFCAVAVGLVMKPPTQSIGVLFDVDGTLSDSYQLGFKSTNEILKMHGLSPIDEAAYHEGTRLTTPRRLAWHVTGDPDNAIGVQLGQEFDDLYVQLVSTTTAALYPGIRELLESCKQADVLYAALSNACTAYVEAVLRVNQLESLFPLGLGADTVPAAKPAADGLLLICSRLGLDPSVCVYVGDSPSDGAAARAAGMHSIGVTWGSHSREKVEPAFEVTVHSVPELMQQIQKHVSAARKKLSTETEVAAA